MHTLTFMARSILTTWPVATDIPHHIGHQNDITARLYADLHVRKVVSPGGEKGVQHARVDGRRPRLSGQEVRHQAGLS